MWSLRRVSVGGVAVHVRSRLHGSGAALLAAATVAAPPHPRCALRTACAASSGSRRTAACACRGLQRAFSTHSTGNSDSNHGDSDAPASSPPADSPAAAPSAAASDAAPAAASAASSLPGTAADGLTEDEALQWRMLPPHCDRSLSAYAHALRILRRMQAAAFQVAVSRQGQAALAPSTLPEAQPVSKPQTPADSTQKVQPSITGVDTAVEHGNTSTSNVDDAAATQTAADTSADAGADAATAPPSTSSTAPPTAASPADGAAAAAPADAQPEGQPAPPASDPAMLVARVRPTPEELKYATEQFQSGNRAPLTALLRRMPPVNTAGAASPSAASDPNAPPSNPRRFMPPSPEGAVPLSWRMHGVPFLPWSRPLLPGMRTTLRVPTPVVEAWITRAKTEALAHAAPTRRRQPKKGGVGAGASEKASSLPDATLAQTPFPKYLAIFARLDAQTQQSIRQLAIDSADADAAALGGTGGMAPPIPVVTAAATETRAHTNQKADADADVSATAMEPSTATPPSGVPSTAAALDSSSISPPSPPLSLPASTADAAAPTASAESPPTSTHAPEGTAISPPPAQPSSAAKSAAPTQPSTSPSPRRRGVASASYRGKFRRTPSVLAQRTSSAADAAADAADAAIEEDSMLDNPAFFAPPASFVPLLSPAQSMRTLVSSVYPMGCLVEIISFPASRAAGMAAAVRGGGGSATAAVDNPVSLAALEQALALEGSSGSVGVRVVALNRAGLLGAEDEGHGTFLTDLQVYSDQVAEQIMFAKFKAAAGTSMTDSKDGSSSGKQLIEHAQQVHVGRLAHECHRSVSELIELIKRVERESPTSASNSASIFEHAAMEAAMEAAAGSSAVTGSTPPSSSSPSPASSPSSPSSPSPSSHFSLAPVVGSMSFSSTSSSRLSHALWSLDMSSLSSLADHALSLCSPEEVPPRVMQELLSERRVLHRLTRTLTLVAKSRAVLRAQVTIREQAREQGRTQWIQRVEEERGRISQALKEAQQQAAAAAAAAAAASSSQSPPPSTKPTTNNGDDADDADADADATVDPVNEDPDAIKEDVDPAGATSPPRFVRVGPSRGRGTSSSTGSNDAGASSTSTSTPPPPSFIEEVRLRLEGKVLPDDARTLLEGEIAQLESLDATSERGHASTDTAHSLRKHLDWLSRLPWNHVSAPPHSSSSSNQLRAAQQVLEQEHAGMREIKERILEMVAVDLLRQRIAEKEEAAVKAAAAAAATSEHTASSLSPAVASRDANNTHSKILCLVGPPGVGKTSVGRAIAQALGRQFARIPVGGLGDVAEIKGVRRTYQGALPGSIIRALKVTGVSNPVILIDEIDKIGSGGGGHSGGDPAAALLEVLDPEQNREFVDHFIDVGVDLSRVLFVLTANDLGGIPAPLRDRTEVLHMHGYTSTEKVDIASNFLLPKLHKGMGVRQGEQLHVSTEAIREVIEGYAREAGVRGLQKQLEKIMRKVAHRIAKGQLCAPTPTTTTASTTTTTTSTPADVAASPAPVPVPAPVPTPWLTIDASNVSDYLGQRRYASDRLYPRVTPIGVAMGLSYSGGSGGATMFIESSMADEHEADEQGMEGQAEEEEALSSRDSNSPAPRPPADTVDEDGEDGEDAEDSGDDVHGSLSGGGASGRGGFFTTGSLGSVMKESSSLAYTLAKGLVAVYAPDRLGWFQSRLVHVHFPAGSQKKEGPSAGITMLMSLLSLALQRPLAPDVALTGEITLTGRITRVGGLRDKLLAAHRAHVGHIVLPRDSEVQVDEIAKDAPELVQGVQLHYVSHIDEVVHIVFPHIRSAQATSMSTQDTTSAGARPE